MKKLTLILITICLFSCSTVKKSISSKKSFSDSTVKENVSLTQLNKKDSTGTATTQTTQSKNSDSKYKKTTVIREYYAGGSNPDSNKAVPGYYSTNPVKASDYFPIETKSPGKGQLLFVEKVITEEGQTVKQEDIKELTEQTSIKSENDSTNETKSKETKSVIEESETNKDVTKQRIINGSAVILLFGGLIFIAYRVYKSKI
jgi:uncharacterized protein YceK